MGKLSGKVAVVTGAASGIGRGIAVAFAAEGSDVAVVDIAEQDSAATVLAEISALGRKALFVRCDVSSEDDVRRMAGEVLGRFGRVDILVNNAGIFTQSLLADMPVADWDRVVGVNLRGTFLCTRMLIGQMLERSIGSLRFTLLYFAALLAGSAGALIAWFPFEGTRQGGPHKNDSNHGGGSADRWEPSCAFFSRVLQTRS